MTDTATPDPMTAAMAEWNEAKAGLATAKTQMDDAIKLHADWVVIEKAKRKAFDAAYAAERGLGTRKNPRKPKESAQ